MSKCGWRPLPPFHRSSSSKPLITLNVDSLFLSRYGDLLALAEDYEEMNRSTRVLRQVPSRRASQAAIGTATGRSKGKLHDKDDSESSPESSDVSPTIKY